MPGAHISQALVRSIAVLGRLRWLSRSDFVARAASRSSRSFSCSSITSGLAISLRRPRILCRLLLLGASPVPTTFRQAMRLALPRLAPVARLLAPVARLLARVARLPPLPPLVSLRLPVFSFLLLVAWTEAAS